MKKYITSAAKIFLVAGMLMPLASMAQEEQKKDGNNEKDKFSYGAPNYWRPYSKNGIGVFETTKKDNDKKYEGMKIRFGAGFTQTFQNLKHQNPLSPNSTGTGANRLYPIAPGFQTAQANMYIDAQLGDGIQLNVTNYLSTRHHNETWVKGGYIQFDKLPFKGKFWTDLMKVTTIKIGHYELNYGDAHFRRPDAGQSIQAPFIEGNIMDAFTTEIGGEVILQKNGFFGILGMTSGMIKGNADSAYKTPQDANTKRNPSLLLKGGYDKQLTEKVRLRLSGSLYTNSSQAGSGLTLYGGDRAGSHYYNVMDKAPIGTHYYTSGRFNPGFSKKLTAVMFNTFVKAYGFELFGTYETAKGRSKTETAERKATQYAVEGLYRFGKNENLYIGAKYNSLNVTPAGFTSDVNINRTAFAAGWFLTDNVLLKAEYVTQKYLDFPSNDWRYSGKFNGYVIEAVVGF